MGKIKYYSRLAWDSRTFGYPVAQLSNSIEPIQLQKAVDHAKKAGIRLLYLSIDPDNASLNQEANKIGGLLVDQKITYRLDIIDKKKLVDAKDHVHSYKKKVVHDQLLSLALQSGVYSRFLTDPHFVNGEFSKLYSIWIRKSVQHKIAFDVLTYEDANHAIKGFITLELKHGSGNIGLIAVDLRSRAQSIGKTLMLAAFTKFYELGHKTVYVTTQRKNKIGCRFYESLGFKIYQEVHMYHFWL